ncbi:MAG TPA: hypothetical protein VMB73_15050 [Acetobacteraceae bacterium]|jgi:hypothetical protein|nr:hypothetical protein [Acetobacteraceae bacterium]
MAGEADDPEDAAARLEAALERIAQLAGTRLPLPSESAAEGGSDQIPPVDEIAARLDSLIDRLRKALGGSSGSKPG